MYYREVTGMTQILQRTRTFALLTVLLLLAACAPGGDTSAVDTSNGEPSADGSDSSEGDERKFAMLLVGPIDDADWNASAHESLEEVGEQSGMETAFSDAVATTDVERVARQYIADGYDIVSLHTSAWSTIVTDLAREFPDVQFIGMNAGEEIPDHPDNLWMITLKFYPDEYVMGYLGGKVVGDDGKVGFIGGIPVPSVQAGGNATLRGAREANPDVGLEYTFTGDFNDSVKARQSAEALIDEGVQFLMVHLNAGVPGAVEAIREADSDVKWAGLYTDKRELSPDNYVGSIIYDFTTAYENILDEIDGGTTSGQMELTSSLTELYNVDDAVAEEVQDVFDRVMSGDIEVENKTDEVTVPE